VKRRLSYGVGGIGICSKVVIEEEGCPKGYSASGPCIRHRHGKSRLPANRGKSKRTVPEQLNPKRQGQSRDELFRCRASQSDELLEIVGGSNFGVRSDNTPNWGSKTCTPNLQSGLINADSAAPPPSGVQIETGTVCPIAGSGTDAATPAVDTWNEITPGVFNYLADIDGVKSVPAGPTVGKTIADQLVRAGRAGRATRKACRSAQSLALITAMGLQPT